MSVLFGGEGQKERGEDAKGTKNSLHHSMPQDVGSEANAKTISSRISNLPRPLPPLPAGQKGEDVVVEWCGILFVRVSVSRYRCHVTVLASLCLCVCKSLFLLTWIVCRQGLAPFGKPVFLKHRATL